MFVTHILFIFCAISRVTSEIKISDEDYKLLPPIFHIDPYDKCLQENKTFCRISIKLSPSKNKTKIWNLIEETKISKRFYNHDELYYAICVENGQKNETLSELYTNKFKNASLRATVVEINCQEHKYEIKTFDILVLTCIILYLLLILVATLYHLKTPNGHKFLILFSPWHNFQNLKRNFKQRNCEKLKCIQGIRFYTTVLIIFCHTFCSYSGGYIANTKYLEDFPQNFIRHGLRNLFVFLVQTFFLVSGWLLSYNTFKIFDKTKRGDFFKYWCLTFLNRYLRLIPPVLLMVSLGTSVWIYGSFHGPIKYVYSDREYERCQRSWWVIFLFLSNHYQQHDMCYFTNWYLSADTQLYAISLVLLIIILKFERLRVRIMTIFLLIGIFIPSLVAFFYELDIIYRITPENSKNNLFQSFEFSATYTSTYSTWATYILGLILGYVYFRLENRPVFGKKHFVLLWYILVIGLPLSVIIISSFEFNRVASALLAGILKPLYALGIGIGIFGMSQQIGGFLKSLCEWKPALFLGNVTYSTYVVHFGIVFSRTALATKPLPVSDYVLFVSFVEDTVWSFLCGFLMHLLVEMPASQLQKMLVPKFSHGSEKKIKK
ncbi:Nose resistant to fluoxetine protein 6-like protein [Tribolium castaneum]|uniref:Nose resistant to fluoxetine protein 6-like protein n=1 Tax=Tribolium castaneum TaxID=7070 RepID=A0A139WFS5_TRICA|nr:PREDICTED: O-acetyltransferase OatA [Tribolium castaneum]KYB26695.1 Nose resistant to fluoxetine protein 6-like protein [Tribolium castaneum]|eukprot:XP_008200185.2 PREDICTED: O-acetyltransferase OatA [Tribolium castaneum]